MSENSAGQRNLDNAAFALRVQHWLVSRGHQLEVDGWAGDRTAKAWAQEVGAPVPPVKPQLARSGLAALFPQTRLKVEAVLADPEASRLGLRVVSTFRSFAEQARLYEQGRSTPGPIVTNARAGQSMHNVRRAVDMAPEQLTREPGWAPNSNLWQMLGALYERHGLSWGGRWSKPDNPHGEDRWCSACGREHKPEGFMESGDCRLGS